MGPPSLGFPCPCFLCSSSYLLLSCRTRPWQLSAPVPAVAACSTLWASTEVVTCHQRGEESWTGSKPHSCKVLPGERQQKWDLGTSQEASPSDGFTSQRENTCIYVMVLKRIEADMTKRLFVVNLAGVILRDYYAILLTSVNF